MVQPEIKSEAERKRFEASDPILSMLGVGKELWKRERGDDFVERLRSEEAPVPVEDRNEIPSQKQAESVWDRIKKHQGEEFRTARRLPFTYAVEGTGIWFFRDGRRINRKLTRTQVQVAITRCPLRSTTEIKDLMDYPYLFALLTDARIRSQAW